MSEEKKEDTPAPTTRWGWKQKKSTVDTTLPSTEIHIQPRKKSTAHHKVEDVPGYTPFKGRHTLKSISVLDFKRDSTIALEESEHEHEDETSHDHEHEKTSSKSVRFSHPDHPEPVKDEVVVEEKKIEPERTKSEPSLPAIPKPESHKIKKEQPENVETKKEEPKKEEPVKEEPVKEEPKKEEPVKEEPKKEEPVKEEPKKEEPVKEEPLKKEPIREEPKEEPKKEEPKPEEPHKEEPKIEELKKPEPKKEEPKKPEPKKSIAQKVEPKKTLPKPVEPKKTLPKPVEPKKSVAKPVPPKKPLPKKEEPKKPEPKKEPPKLPASLEPSMSSISFTSLSSASEDMGSYLEHRYSTKKRRIKKPRPSQLRSRDFDDDEDGITVFSESSQTTVPSSPRLSIIEGKQKPPDDELLYSLTQKEEYVFRKSISEMRWEEEESMHEDTDDAMDREAAAALLWERIGQAKLNAPTITVNDKRISLGHLDPEDDETEEDQELNSASYHKVFQEDHQSNSSDSDPVQTIFDLIDESNRRRRDAGTAESKRDSARVKLWRRRLIVVILLNFVMRFRMRTVTFYEVIVPIIVFWVLLVGAVKNTEIFMKDWKDDHQMNTRRFDPFGKIGTETMLYAFCSNEEFCDKQSDRHFYIVYSPQSKFTDSLMQRVVHFLKFRNILGRPTEASKLVPVNTSDQVEEACAKQWHGLEEDTDSVSSDKRLTYPIGIIFSYDNGLIHNEKRKEIDEDRDVPQALLYTIRTYFIELANTAEGYPFRERRSFIQDQPAKNTAYLSTGILGLQLAIDFAFTEKLLNHSLAVGDTFMQIKLGDDETLVSRKFFFERFLKEPMLKQFEYPAYKDPEQRFRGWIALSIFITMAYVICDITVAQEIVAEARGGSIELLKIHGMTTGMRWIAYLIITAFLRAWTSLAIALILHFEIAWYAVAPFQHPFFLWLFLWMHGCSVTCFNYFIATGWGIKKTELAGIVVVLVSFGSMLCPMYLFYSGDLERFGNMVLCFLLPQWNLANGIYSYMRFELYEEGFEWYDFPVLLDTKNHRIMALLFSCNIFLYSTMFYIGLTIYMDHILPREFSPKESWLYFLQSFLRKPPSETTATRPIPKHERPAVYEPGPIHVEYGPRLRNVTLTESKMPTHLDNISLDMYEGEVTCLVGQIGSGKSDLLNCIAGVRVPTAGYVDVKGMHVHEYHDITNRYVSLCPQKQLLLEYLSVEDHIRLCCMLHGAAYQKAKTQASFLLKMFDLMPMRRHNYKGLTTSDMKKLLVAMALSKSPSVLLLDNPIDQLDAEAKFEFWKLLQELKPQRSIVVSCTTLEDAQLFGDRIAILSKGKLVCYGTPAYIKLAYGIGSVLSLRMAENSTPDVKRIQNVIDRELMGAKSTFLETKGASLEGDTLKFILPYGKFCSGIIEKVEDKMEVLQIEKIAVAQPSLWALYHKIATSRGVEHVLALKEVHHLKGLPATQHDGFDAAMQTEVPVEKSLSRSVISIIYILVMKKLWYYRQKYWISMVGYLPQYLMLLQLIYISSLFVSVQPEGVAKEINIGMFRHKNSYVLFRSADNEHTRPGWEEAFSHVLQEDDKSTNVDILGHNDDLEAFLASGKKHTLSHYKKQANVAFTRDKTGHVGYFASNALHSAGIAAHVIMQVFIYMMSQDRKHPHRTVFVSHPLQQYETYPASSTQSDALTTMGLVMSLILALLIVPALRIIRNEHETKLKTIQRMAGVPASVYWFSHGLADILVYLLISLVCVVSMIFLDMIGFQLLLLNTERATLAYIFVAWLCWAAIPYSYFVEMMMGGVGYVPFLFIHFMLGIVPKVILYQILPMQVTGLTKLLRYIMYIFPPYSITSACVHFFQIVEGTKWCHGHDEDHELCHHYKNISATIQRSNPQDDQFKIQVRKLLDEMNVNVAFSTCCTPFCNATGTCYKSRPFFPDTSAHSQKIPGLMEDMIALVFNGLFFWILVILLEKQFAQNICSFIITKLCGNLEKTVAQRDLKTSEEPEDVKEEHQKVDFMVEIEGDVESEVYLVQDVTKFFKYTKGLDHISFSIPIKATTGILGLPKSGKTTMLEVLTGQVTPSSGFVYKDNDLLDGNSRHQLTHDVGYCPQKPCVLPYLTPAQMLTIMGRLRGLSSSECSQHVTSWLKLFELEVVASKKCSMLGNGQLRRVVSAMALIGGTKMIIFDEPTVNMDDSEKYIFWNVVSRLPKDKRTILFASTDAKEVQHQSSKVLVLDAGQLAAVGNLNKIFSHNQGILLAVRYGSSAAMSKYTDFQRKTKINKLKDHVVQYLSPCSLLDEQGSLLIYHLKDQSLKLSRIYAVMEGAKVKYASIVDLFQVFEPSLDDIILQLHKSRAKQ